MLFNSSVGVIDTVFRFEPFADTDGIHLIIDSSPVLFFLVRVIHTVVRFKPVFADTDGVALILDSTLGF